MSWKSSDRNVSERSWEAKIPDGLPDTDREKGNNTPARAVPDETERVDVVSRAVRLQPQIRFIVNISSFRTIRLH